MASTSDVVVIGAGVIGAAVALELARGGRSVTVVDRGPSPGAGSTSASSAIVRFNYSTWTGVAVAWESRAAWLDWTGHLGGTDAVAPCRYTQTGGLVIDPPEASNDSVFAHFDRAGIGYEQWDADTMRRRLPHLDVGRHHPPKAVDDDAFWAEPAGEVSGYWTPQAGWVDDPQLATQNLARAAQRHGARFLHRAEVVEVLRSGERVGGVRLLDGAQVHAPVVVNAAGPHSARVNALAGVLGDFTVTTRALRQEVHAVNAPPPWATEPGPFVADLDLGVYLRGAPGGGLLVGGLEPACDPLQWVDDPDRWDPNPSQLLRRTYLYRAARRLPDLRVPEAARGIAGLYDVTDDWIPVYDRTCLPGFYVAVGTSGNQFKNAPVVGRLLAALVEACESGHDHDADPVQVPLPRTGTVADMGHYSRRRQLHRGSSFSVLG
ncbi:MAG TPA: FAD-dependent oxidoreductase [Mycobacteriales bacterium]|nr:FAD-dependent oxidoreductase [Mycobacteriales bacterium]